MQRYDQNFCNGMSKKVDLEDDISTKVGRSSSSIFINSIWKITVPVFNRITQLQKLLCKYFFLYLWQFKWLKWLTKNHTYNVPNDAPNFNSLCTLYWCQERIGPWSYKVFLIGNIQEIFQMHQSSRRIHSLHLLQYCNTTQ